MKYRYKMIAVVLCMVMLLCACGTQNTAGKSRDSKETADSKEQTSEESKEDSQDPEAAGNAAKLALVEPAAYQSVDGLDLEEGAFISIIGKGADGQFWKAVEKGAKQAAEDINEMLGYTGKSQVKVTYSGPVDSDSVDQQVNILDEELARYPVAVGIAITDMQACGVQFDLAGQGDIPIVAFDSGSDYPGLNATVSTDNKETSVMAADKLAELMNSNGEILIFVHDSKSQTGIDRENNFVTQIGEQYPDITIGAVYHMDQLETLKKELVESGETSKTVEELSEEAVIDELLKKHPNVKGVYATNEDSVKLALDGIRRNNLAPFFVGYDEDKEVLRAVSDGAIDGLIVQNPYGMGYVAVVAAARAALKMGNEAVINTGYVWVTKDNIDTDEVQKLLY